ncbi:hypothetical protein K4G90_22230, partial [Mycobacterium tuberculosis]|nr:hypothetical protein [Mycobacterium tuberculosis]
MSSRYERVFHAFLRRVLPQSPDRRVTAVALAAATVAVPKTSPWHGASGRSALLRGFAAGRPVAATAPFRVARSAAGWRV